MDSFKNNIIKELNSLKELNNYRNLKNISFSKDNYIFINNKKYLDFSSNNYLGLKDNPEVINASIEATKKYGAGSVASRLISGDCELYYNLEKIIANLKNKERALLFNSGYSANLGVISTLFNEKDVIFCDKLNHASIYDGIKLSCAKLIRYKHNDIEDLKLKLEKNRSKYKNALLITDSIFSMDGDIALLKEIISLKEKFNFILMVDEAHATGIYGKNGGGITEELNILDKIDINMGTLGKSIGTFGAYIAADNYIVEYLINKCRAFIFTTFLPPSCIGGAIKSFEIIKNNPSLRKTLIKNSNFLRNEIKNIGFSTLNSQTQIIPIVCNSNDEALDFSNFLMENGIFAPSIRYPTVPKNLPRIRLSLNALHSEKDIDYLLKIIKNYKLKKG